MFFWEMSQVKNSEMVLLPISERIPGARTLFEQTSPAGGLAARRVSRRDDLPTRLGDGIGLAVLGHNVFGPDRNDGAVVSLGRRISDVPAAGGIAPGRPSRLPKRGRRKCECQGDHC